MYSKILCIYNNNHRLTLIQDKQELLIEEQ